MYIYAEAKINWKFHFGGNDISLSNNFSSATSLWTEIFSDFLYGFACLRWLFRFSLRFACLSWVLGVFYDFASDFLYGFACQRWVFRCVFFTVLHQIFFMVLHKISLRFCKSERGEGSSPGVPQYHNQPSDLVSSKLLLVHKEESTLPNKLTKKLEVMITCICFLFLWRVDQQLTTLQILISINTKMLKLHVFGTTPKLRNYVFESVSFSLKVSHLSNKP